MVEERVMRVMLKRLLAMREERIWEPKLPVPPTMEIFVIVFAVDILSRLMLGNSKLSGVRRSTLGKGDQKAMET